MPSGGISVRLPIYQIPLSRYRGGLQDSKFLLAASSCSIYTESDNELNPSFMFMLTALPWVCFVCNQTTYSTHGLHTWNFSWYLVLKGAFPALECVWIPVVGSSTAPNPVRKAWQKNHAPSLCHFHHSCYWNCDCVQIPHNLLSSAYSLVSLVFSKMVLL